MRPASDNLLETLTGSFDLRMRVSVFHGTDRIHKDLYPTAWSFDENLEAEVKSSGSCTIAFQDPDGKRVLPSGTEGDFSAFRARLLFELETSAGGITEVVKLGWGRVTANPQGIEETATVDGATHYTSAVIPLEWDGLEDGVRRRGFRVPAIAQGTSAWAEVARITGMPVTRNAPDALIPAGTVWDPTAGGRLKAVQVLGDLLGGRFVVDPSGYLTLVPHVVGPVVATLSLGERGTVADVAEVVDTVDVFNAVVGIYEGPLGLPLYASAEITEGPLAVSGPYGENTLYDTDGTVATQAQADARVKRLLSDSVGSYSYRVPVQCVINPLIQMGDHVKVEGWTRPLSGRVVTLSMSDSALMNVTLEVTRRVA